MSKALRDWAAHAAASFVRHLSSVPFLLVRRTSAVAMSLQCSWHAVGDPTEHLRDTSETPQRHLRGHLRDTSEKKTNLRWLLEPVFGPKRKKQNSISYCKKPIMSLVAATFHAGVSILISEVFCEVSPFGLCKF